MNLLLFGEHEYEADGCVHVTGPRAQHMQQVLAVQPGDRIRVGMTDGLMGEGCVLAGNAQEGYRLSVVLDQQPPPLRPVVLVLALPRPKVLKRTLQLVAGLGVKHLILIHSARVEKSFWSTPWLREESIRQQCLEGLSQVRDTCIPLVELRHLFRPFVEDELPILMQGRRALLADPQGEHPCPVNIKEPTLLLVGPEGGWVPFERTLLESLGVEMVHCGARILKVDWAISALIGQLYPC